MRVFRDDAGVEWVVWAVRPGGEELRGAAGGPGHPAGPERRRGPDRRVAPAPEPVIERRRADQRLAGADRAASNRIARTMPPALVQGWLAFQSDTARRRLAPIPDGWATCPESELTELCRQARAVAPAMTPVPRIAAAAPAPEPPTSADAPPNAAAGERSRSDRG